jgi:WD40 repeat protein
MVLTASDDHTVRLWSHEDVRLLNVLEGAQGSVQHAFFSPDGSRVVANTDNDRTWLWDVKTGFQLTH